MGSTSQRRSTPQFVLSAPGSCQQGTSADCLGSTCVPVCRFWGTHGMSCVCMNVLMLEGVEDIGISCRLVLW